MPWFRLPRSAGADYRGPSDWEDDHCIDAILNQKGQVDCIYVAIGQKESTVRTQVERCVSMVLWTIRLS